MLSAVASSGKTSPLDAPAIDALWLEAAAAMGFAVVRTADAYASTDGKGTLIIGTRETLDTDDSLAQLVLHEICHALVQGEANWKTPDWGLDNTTSRDDVRELACLRLQAHLGDAYGLRRLMRPTTDWKTYYDALSAAPLDARGVTSDDDRAACALAKDAHVLAKRDHIAGPLTRALSETARLCGVSVQMHPVGFPLGPSGETCGSCAWRYQGGRGTAVDRCWQAAAEAGSGVRVDPSFAACARWEPPVDCLTCGACCREAYHSVSVSMRDPVVWKQPAFVVRTSHRFSLLRQGDRCACLGVEPDANSESGRRFGCTIYDDRPQTCRDFERGGRHCLTARRRVGLSR